MKNLFPIFLIILLLGLINRAIGQSTTKQFDCTDFDYYENDTSIFYLNHQDSVDFLNYVIESKVYQTSMSAGFNYSHDTAHLKKFLYEYFYYYKGLRDYNRVKALIELNDKQVMLDSEGENIRLILSYLSHDICVVAKIVDSESVLYRYAPDDAPRLRDPGLHHLQVQKILYSDAKGVAVGDTLTMSYNLNVANKYATNDSTRARREQLVAYTTCSHCKTYKIGSTYLFFLDLPSPFTVVNHIKKYGCVNCGNVQPFCMNHFVVPFQMAYPISDEQTTEKINLITKYSTNK